MSESMPAWWTEGGSTWLQECV